MTKPELPYTVLVDDNYHYLDEGERYTHGRFATTEEAVTAARKIVDDYLVRTHTPGMTAAALYSSYKSFGEDPFIVAPGESVQFSAWDYAEVRCVEICAGEDS